MATNSSFTVCPRRTATLAADTTSPNFDSLVKTGAFPSDTPSPLYPSRAAISAIATLFLMTLAATLAFGQGIVTGSMSGIVQDQQKAVVSGVMITARLNGTNLDHTTESNAAGLFSLSNLPVGIYIVTIEGKGFSKLRIEGVEISSGKETALGARGLTIGTSETIDVEGGAPLIEPSTSRIITTFESRKITDLPIGNGTDFTVLFTPGVVSQGNMSFGNNNGASPSMNGQRGRSVNYQLDGQANNDNSVTGPALPIAIPDSIAEYQVVTNFSAEYGRNTGGVVNVVTKSGTNLYHGTILEQYRNSVFDSLDHEEKATAPYGIGLKVPPKFIENHFEGTLGGPIRRDKMWFYGAGLSDRIRTAGTPTTSAGAITPTPAGLLALDSAFPGNPGVALLKAIGPAANKLGNPVFLSPSMVTVTDGRTSAPIEFAQISRTVSTPQNQQQYIGKFDYQISNKDRVAARYIINDSQRPLGSAANAPSGYRVDQPSRAHQASLDWTRQWTGTFTNQVRMSYTRQHVGFEGGDTGCLENTITLCPTNVAFTGAANFLVVGMATNIPQDRNVNNTQWQDNASWLIGKHSLKLGGEFDRQRSPSTFLPDVNGRYTFGDTTGFTAFDNLLRNKPSQFNEADGPTKFNFKEKDAAWYVQDDWRVLDNLTLNLGLRWEWTQQAFNLLHDLTAKQQTGSNPFWDSTLPLSRTTVASVPEDLNNFAPKIGFAYTPHTFPGIFGKEKTVIRGGFGIAYDEPFYNIFLNTATSAPVVNAGQLSTVAGQDVPGLPFGNFTGATIRAATLSLIPHGAGVDPGGRSWTTVAPNFHNPYVEQWSVGVQREVGTNVAAEVRYVGNHGVGLYRSINGNPALKPFIDNGFTNLILSGLTPCNTPNTPGFAQKYVDCLHTNVFERINGASSVYHGLQSSLNIRGKHGITAFLAYTFSHNIDTSSEVFNSTGGAGAGAIAIPTNPFDASALERGRSAIDFPNTFSIQFIYELPFYKTQSGFIGHLLGGWQLNSDYRYNSGEPATLYQSKLSATNSPLCDPASLSSATVDTCRPVLENPSAPFTSVGRIAGFDGSGFGSPQVVNLANCNSKATTGSPGCPLVPLNSVHFLLNNLQAAQFLGSPFRGVARNTERGDYISNANLSIFKNTKLTERFTLEFHATAYNFMNREFLGVQDTRITDVVPNGTTPGAFNNIQFNSTGDGSPYVVSSGLGRRRLEFTTKIIF